MHLLIEVYAPKFGNKTLGRCGELELNNLKLSKSAWSGFCGDGTKSKLYDPDLHMGDSKAKVKENENKGERKKSSEVDSKKILIRISKDERRRL
jgi:hypothetical protein